MSQLLEGTARRTICGRLSASAHDRSNGSRAAESNKFGVYIGVHRPRGTERSAGKNKKKVSGEHRRPAPIAVLDCLLDTCCIMTRPAVNFPTRSCTIDSGFAFGGDDDGRVLLPSTQTSLLLLLALTRQVGRVTLVIFPAA
jgi:hypothetical protein